MNKELYDKSWDFPKDLQNHMRICFAKVKNADANTEGYNRNRRLQTATTISYPELKRVKNFFSSSTRLLSTCFHSPRCSPVSEILG